MIPLELVKLAALMARTRGSPEIKVAVIDGPVIAEHIDLDVALTSADTPRLLANERAAPHVCTEPL